MSYLPNNYRTYKFKSSFTASSTKFRYFNDCERKYFLHTYGSWDSGAEALGISYDLQLEVRRLKKLDTLDSIAGTATHAVIAEIANGRRRNSSEILHLFDTLESRILRKYDDMLKSAYKVTNNSINGMIPSSDEKILSELYLCSDSREKAIEYLKTKNIKVKDKISEISKNLLSSPIFKDITQPNSQIKLIEKEGFPKIVLFDSDIYANIDLAYYLPQSNYYIVVDWKTGEPDPKVELKQLILYAIYISEKFLMRDLRFTENTLYINEYLSVGRRYTHLIDVEAIEEYKNYLKRNIELLKSRLKDIDNNLPYNILEYSKSEDDRICKTCEMRKICEQWGNL